MEMVKNIIRPALLCLLVMTVFCGVIYTGAVTGIAQLIFPGKADGSIITVTLEDGTKKAVGSTLIGQGFTRPEYLVGRPMGVSNLSPYGEKYRENVETRIKWWRAFDPGNSASIPADLLTGSGSGIDPDISPEAAEFQAARIAHARNISEDEVRGIINKYTSGRLLGFWGEPSVNVLRVNLALDGLL